MFENNELFPDRVNTEFVEVMGRNHLKMRVWEQGSGKRWPAARGLALRQWRRSLRARGQGQRYQVRLLGGS